MTTPILATKLYTPQPRLKAVSRPRLIERLNEGLRGRLILISAAAGFGKTTLLSEWVVALAPGSSPNGGGRVARVAWLSLDEGDSDPVRFLVYLVAALQTLAPDAGKGVLAALQSPQPPSAEAMLTSLLNDIAAIPDPFVLVLDDFHAVEAPAVDQAVAFLLDHLPPQMRLAIATREDPQLPLARLRARGQLAELRAADLRFSPAEAAEFLNQAMGLNLSAEEIAALEARTEGWIAGLQLAALSMQGLTDTAGFVEAFGGSHRYVLDYLMEEVLQRQPPSIQTFLLRTSILDRLCGPLCDAVMGISESANHEFTIRHSPFADSQSLLEHLDRANLFIVPLDSERRWYRYHRLFAELLRQRLAQQEPDLVADLHLRASAWYEESGLELEAFQHAAAANDVPRAERLLEGKGMPLLFRGAVRPVLSWLASLPAAVLDDRPALWITYASALLFVQQIAGVEEKLQAAEAALADVEPDDRVRDLIGHIASIRATVAVVQHDQETILTQSQAALAFLRADNLPVRTAAHWSLAYAYHLQGDRAAAGRAYAEAVAASQALGHYIIHLMATLGLANIQEADTHLALAAETFRRALELAGDPPIPVACEAHLGLARISYQWNELAAAGQHGEQSLRLAQTIENSDRSVAAEVFLARLRLAQGDRAGAVALLTRAEQAARQHGYTQQMAEAAAEQLLMHLRQGNLAAAAALAQRHDLPLGRARVQLAHGDTSAALATLAAWQEHAESKGWVDEQLKIAVLQAIVHQTQGDRTTAVARLADALALAEPGGFIRLFVDEGPPMAQLLSDAAARGMMPDYVRRLLAVFGVEKRQTEDRAGAILSQPQIEPLSQRELEILRLIALGLSNHEIGERLFLALDTIKGYNRRIYDKLQVERRTEAVARARELGLL